MDRSVSSYTMGSVLLDVLEVESFACVGLHILHIRQVEGHYGS